MEMELCTMWVIICMFFLQLALSYNVMLYPELTITDVGNNAVTFTCTIQLETNETTVKHWIVWWKDDNARIVDNDVVLLGSTKYSVHGISSTAMTEYTQILQVNGIQETDHDMYTCTLFFPSYPPGNTQLSLSAQAPIIIRNFISQPSCSTIQSKHETGQQQVQFNELFTISHKVSNVSESSNQLFTCRATSAGSTNTKECVISYQLITSIAVTQKLSEQFDERSTVIPTKTTHNDTSLKQFITKMSPNTQTVTERKKTDTTVKVTQEMLLPSGDKKSTITIIVVAGVILITVFIILVHLKKRIKKRNYKEDGHPEKGINTHNGNQLNSIELGDGHLDDQCFVYRNSVFEINMNDPVNLYSSIDQETCERSLKHVAMDDNKKANDIYPLQYYGYKQESITN